MIGLIAYTDQSGYESYWNNEIFEGFLNKTEWNEYQVFIDKKDWILRHHFKTFTAYPREKLTKE